MKKYRKKQEVLVWKWMGDSGACGQSVVDKINKDLSRFNKNDEKFEAVVNGDILTLSHKIGGHTSNYFLRIGEYAVLDINQEIMPLMGCSKEYLNNNYVRLDEKLEILYKELAERLKYLETLQEEDPFKNKDILEGKIFESQLASIRVGQLLLDN